MTDAILVRLDYAERRLRSLERELADLRRLASAEVAAPADDQEHPQAPEPTPLPSRPQPAQPPRLPQRPDRLPEPPLPAPPPLRPAASAPAATMPAPRRHVVRLPELDMQDLLGARGLAWAGGVVTLLGVVFFFVLAVNNGWIGPVERVVLGAAASVAVLAAGVLARARFGQLYSALAAVGAGIAGGYATLLAAAALYDLVPGLAALAIAAAIAALGTWIALAWSSEMLAGLGLVGATLVPLSVAFDGGPSLIGTAFAAIVFAAACAVALRRGWDRLLAAAFTAAAPQIAVLVLQEGEGAGPRMVLLTAAFVGLFLAAGILRQRWAATAVLRRTATTLVLASAALGGLGAPALLNGQLLGLDREALALLALAIPYAALGAALFASARSRDLAMLLAALAMVLSGAGLAALLGGATLAITWAVQAAAFAWLARAVREPRFAVAASAYLVLGVWHVLAFEAPLTELYRQGGAPGDGILPLLTVAAAAVVVAWQARGWVAAEHAGGGPLARSFATFAERRRTWSALTAAAALVGGLYGGALGALALVEAAGVRPAFAWGHVAVVVLWSSTAAAALVARARRGAVGVQAAGATWLAVTAVHVVLFSLPVLPGTQSGWAALALAAASLGAGFLAEAFRHGGAVRPLGTTLAAIGTGAGFTTIAVLRLLESPTDRGLGFAAAAALHAALAAFLFDRPGRRDATTLLWGIAVGFATAAAALLLDGTTFAVGLAALALVLAAAARATGERRLEPAAAVLAGATAAYALVALAPLRELLVANASPADGAPGAALGALALAVVALLVRRPARASEDGLDASLDELRPRAVRSLEWAAAVLGVYAGSLAILGAVAWVGGADVTTEFQRGHTAVSGFWALIALVALYAGVARGWQAIRLAGFALFGVSLGKLFLYDLSTLSSVTRALSFLGVGALLLLAGFFYQRLTAEPRA